MFNRIRLTISYLTNSPILPGTTKDRKHKIKIRVESKGQLQIVTFFERPSSIPLYENYPNQNSFIREFLIYYLNSLNGFIEIYKSLVST